MTTFFLCRCLPILIRYVGKIFKHLLNSILLKRFTMSSANVVESKRSCTVIGTHNGNFHCDEILACFMLQNLPKYKDSKIIRTRDLKLLDSCNIVVDVGGVYDHQKNRYDHHQRSFSETFNSLNPKKPWTTKLSSAGLIYYHFGREVIASILGNESSKEEVEAIYDKVYERFVEEVDGIDNGINAYDGEPRFHITTNLSSRVGSLNPSWNDKNPDSDANFYKAMDMIGSEFVDKVKYYYNSWLPAKVVVETALKNRFQVDPSGEIMEFTDGGGCPWRDHLFNLEQDLNIDPIIKFILFTDQTGSWRVQGVPPVLGSFDLRVPLAEKWRGLRDEDLSEKSGIADCIFCHASGFIGGNKTRAGVLEMAKKSLEFAKIKA
ncbi:UPF0160 protein MYG1, mitochondrial [Nymphon striatum]|nr:UPF0160 protein MYG1, mitochondrial [Nymphon striatum]